MHVCPFRPFLFGDDSSLTHIPEQATGVVQVCARSPPCCCSSSRQHNLVIKRKLVTLAEKASDANNGDDSAIAEVNVRWHQELLGREESWYTVDGLLHLTDLVGRKACRRAYLHRYSHRYELYILHLLAPLRGRDNGVRSAEPVIHMYPRQGSLTHSARLAFVHH